MVRAEPVRLAEHGTYIRAAICRPPCDLCAPIVERQNEHQRRVRGSHRRSQPYTPASVLIVDLLQTEDAWMGVQEIAERISRDVRAVQAALLRMLARGELRRRDAWNQRWHLFEYRLI